MYRTLAYCHNWLLILGGRVVTVIQSKDGNGETNDNMMTRQGDNVIFG